MNIEEIAKSHMDIWKAGYREGLDTIRSAATKWPRCCDLWQDSLGGMHCRDCEQKTFAMLFEVQKTLGVNKSCEPIDVSS